MTIRNQLVLLLILAALAACDQPSTEMPAQSAADINAILYDYDEAYLKLNPFSATFRGDSRYNDRFVNWLTDEHLEATRALAEEYLAKVMALDPEELSDQDRLSYEIFTYQKELQLEGFEQGFARAETYLPFNQFNSFPNDMALFGSGQGIQPFDDVEDYENWLKRAAGFPGWVESAIARMREGIDAGVVHPRILMEKALPQIVAQVVEDPRDSMFYRPIRNMPDSIPIAQRKVLDEAYRDLIAAQLVPAYARLHAYVRDDYLPHTRDTVGRMYVTNGKAWYRHLAKYYTTTDLTPEEIHEIGLREVERIVAEMEQVKEQTDFEGSLQEFFTYLRTDPRFFHESGEAVLRGYEARRAIIQPRLGELFEIRPRSDYILMEIEAFRAASAAAAQYRPGSIDGARPGVFYVNTYDLKARPTWRMDMLSLHEAEPGHHFQISLAQEIKDLPAFRRHARFTAFTEGWGLYTESLGKELGMYADPYSYFGSLVADVWRANRLVVDTGMHYMGWTRERAIEFMQQTMPMAEHAIIVEVERYIAYAGQALAYKIGQLKLFELRDRAREALGDEFDIRKFHTQVLMDGAMPLSVLDAKIDRWIAD